jgi:pimeloyl-ACP methyl ester carboxylesterase
MDIILLAGLWLPRSIWSQTATELERLGHRPVPVSLPGVDDDSPDATLEDQVAAALQAVDGADHPVVVGHSAACSLAWIVADRRPESIGSIVLIGGFPTSSGEAYADFFDIVDGGMPFPGWGPFEGPDSDDLDAGARGLIADNALPVPAGVAKGKIELNDDRRFEVPIVLVCPEFSPDQARAWIDAGDVPELEKAQDVSFVDIDTGHWPMVSQPSELARVLSEVAGER